MTLVKRLVKGSALTYAEADGNLDHFTNELALKADLEAELISGGETTVDGTTITVAAASWRVPPSVYAKVTETEFTGITYSGAGNQRYVAFYGNTSNTIVKVEGAEAVTAVLPTQPDNTALISYALVGDSSIGSPTQDLSGYQLKSDKSLDISTDQASDVKYPSVKAVYDWAVGLFQTLANKDATGGYAGLTLFKINFKNAANTFTSFLTNSNTAVRTYLFPDKDGTVAMLDDIPQSHYLGSYTSLANLQAAHPTAIPGDEALVDAGVGEDALKYIWDDSDDAWIQGGGGSAASFATLTGSPSDNAALEARFDEKADNSLSAYTPSSGVVANGDTPQEAIEKLDGNIRDAAISLPELGQIINDDFNRASLGSNWTQVGSSATFNIVGNKLEVAKSGALSVSEYIYWNAYGKSNCTSHTTTFSITVGTLPATGGVCLVNNTLSTFYANSNMQIGILLDSTSNNGKIVFYNGTTTAVLTSPQGLTIVAGDVLNITVKFIKTTYIVSIYNTNTGLTNSFYYEFSMSYSSSIYPPHAISWGIGAMGGTHLIDNFNVEINDPVGATYMGVGDSIFQGVGCDSIVNRCGDIVQEVANAVFLTNAGAGNLIADINTTEILNLAPVNIILLVGTNDISSSGTQAAAQTAFTALVNSLVAGGYVVGTNLFIGLLLPKSTYDLTSYNNWKISQWPTAIIDFFTPLKNPTTTNISSSFSSDFLHPNTEGNRIMGQVLLNRLNIESKPKKNAPLYAPYYDRNEKIMIANKAIIGNTPSSQLHVIDSSGDAPLQISGATGDGGGYFGSIGTNSLLLMGGYRNRGGNYQAKSTLASGIFLYNGGILFTANTGLTSGNNFSPNFWANMGSTGLWRFGDGNGAVSTVESAGSFGANIVTKTANYTATSADYTILVDATSGNLTITLPAASGATKRIYKVKKIDASANTVTIDGNSTETIDGAETKVISTQWDTVTIQCNGTAWFII